jgi:hypothetical protein
MRKSRSQSGLVKIVNATMKFGGFVVLPLLLLSKLCGRVSLRKRDAEFASDIEHAYERLIARYRGVVVSEKTTKQSESFDYVEASLEFVDRTLRFVRGRGELSVTCNGSPIFFGDDSSLYLSVSIAEEHWNELLDADYNQIQKWKIDA